MKCIILAAGYATRLYPLTENFPKPLLKIGNKTILDWLIDDLSNNKDINEFIVVSNHKFVNFFNDWKKDKKCNIQIIDDGSIDNDHRLGAVKDIKLAINYLGNEDALVMAGDNMLDFSLNEFVKYASDIKTSCVMAHIENNLAKKQKTAIITIDKDNLITSYKEKPKDPKGNLAVPPFYYYLNKDINRIDEALNDGCGYDAPGSYAAWLSKHTLMHAYIMPGKRYDIGDLNSYEYVKTVFG